MDRPSITRHLRPLATDRAERCGPEPTRRLRSQARFAILLLAAGLALRPLAAPAQLPPLSLEVVASGLQSPVAVTHAGDERLFITLQGGAIVIFDGERVLPQPFLDISGRVLSGGERGLLSVTFHPGYAQNGRFFVDYTDLGGDTVVSRFAVSGGNPDAALPGSERVLLAIDQPFANHNGGQLQFGPDGYLYVGMGDGGSGNDPFCFAQDDGTLLGKLLRLDVDQNVSTAPFYGIPADNPHRGPGAPLDEIWAEGLRNPWRFSFDRSTGDLFIGDVGQGDREEIDRQPAGSPGGENYGWKMMEGDLCLGSTAGCSFAVPGCNAPAYTAPILTYGRDGGRCAVIGGYVYRGLRIPALYGHYLYGDLCAGTLWAARQVGGAWQAEELGPTAQQLTSFGEELSGEIVLAASNSIYRLTGPPPPSTCTPGPTTLCLQGGRFRATLNWRGAQGNPAAAHAEPLTADSGFFRFNNPDNPEVFVKVLEACDPPFRRFWVFAAGLTNVEASLEVADTDSGQVRVYFNPLGRPFQPIQDTQAFATCP